MPRAERSSDRSDRSLARAESRAREARERGLQAGNAGRPAVGARYIRAGLRQLGWAEDGKQPDARQVHEVHRALAARLLMTLAAWESEQGRTEYGLRLLDQAEASPRRMTGDSCFSSGAFCSCGPGGEMTR